MEKISRREKKALSDFLINVAVAWFTAGVISVFISKYTVFEILVSITWGMVMSLISLLGGMKMVK